LATFIYNLGGTTNPTTPPNGSFARDNGTADTVYFDLREFAAAFKAAAESSNQTFGNGPHRFGNFYMDGGTYDSNNSDGIEDSIVFVFPDTAGYRYRPVTAPAPKYNEIAKFYIPIVLNADNISRYPSVGYYTRQIGDVIERSFTVYFDADVANLTWTTTGPAPCFTRGAKVTGADNQIRNIEDLQEGDSVLTRDGGLQKIRWIGKSVLSAESMEQHEHLRPIVFKANAIGEHEEFRVSPQHRILRMITDEITGEEEEVFVAAKHLVNGTDIIVDPTEDAIEYYHMMFDKHEVICVDNVWSESFYPGEYAISNIDKPVRNEVLTIFPELKRESTEKAYGEMARKSLSGKQVRTILGEKAEI